MTLQAISKRPVEPVASEQRACTSCSNCNKRVAQLALSSISALGNGVLFPARYLRSKLVVLLDGVLKSGILPQFRLNQSETLRMREMLGNCHLAGKNQRLINVFKVEFYSQVSRLRAPPKEIEALQKDFCSICFDAALHADRMEIQKTGKMFSFSKHTNQVFSSAESITKRLTELKKRLSSLSEQQNECLENRLIIEQIQTTVDCFLKIFNTQIDPRTAYHFRIQNFIRLDLTDLSEEYVSPPADRQETWRQLKMYMQCCALSHPELSVVSSKIMKELGRENPLNKKHVVALRKALYAQYSRLQENVTSIDPQEALSLSPQKFEIHLRNKFQAHEFLFLLHIFQNIYDNQFIAKIFPDFVSTENNMRRFCTNMSLCSESVPPYQSSSPLHEASLQFQNFLNETLKPIEREYEPFLHLILYCRGSDFLNKKHTMLEGLERRMNMQHWLIALAPHAPAVSKALQNMRIKTSQMPNKIERFLENYTQNLSAPLSEEQREIIIEQMQDIYMEKTYTLRTLVMIAEDVIAISYGKTALEETRISDLGDVIMIDKLSLLLEGAAPDEQKASDAAATAAVLEEADFSDQGDVSDAFAAAVAAPRHRNVSAKKPSTWKQKQVRDIAEEKEAPPRAAEVEMPPMVDSSSEIQDEMDSILRMTKRREIVKVLEELGYKPIRIKGSHETFRNPENGRQTTVPRHDELHIYTVIRIHWSITHDSPNARLSSERS